jgi:hypothetical protein
MKEHPIIFKSEMVKAILEGRKMQTRRIIKPQPKIVDNIDEGSHVEWSCKKWPVLTIDGLTDLAYYGPYSVGDRLWVRENIRTITYPWQDGKFGYGEYLIEYIADEHLISCPKEHEEWWKHNWHIRPSTTIPSIHMPRWASRILLEVTDIRVERVQDISQEDIESEGLWYYSEEYRNQICIWRDCVSGIQNTRIKYFKQLWDSINAKRGYSWEVNPYVWVITFRRIK